MSEYLTNSAALTHTADRIRAKTGETAQIVWDAEKGFGNAVDAISGSEKIQHADIPDYVKAEALAVAEKVKAVRTSDSIVFIAASDAHQQRGYRGREPERGAGDEGAGLHSAGNRFLLLSRRLHLGSQHNDDCGDKATYCGDQRGH